MGTEILRPQDCLIQRIKVSPCRRRNYFYATATTTTTTTTNNNNYYSNSFHNTNPNPNPNPKCYHDSNPRFNKKPSLRSERTDQKKRQPEQQPLISKRSNSLDDFKISKNYYGSNHKGSSNNNNNNNNLVKEKVTILRRGESLDSKIKCTETVPFMEDHVVVTSTERLGPDPEMVPKQIKIVDLRSPVTGKCDVYAGSGFTVSPAPSSLPLPSFSKKKQVTVDDSATRDLRRLLRLDF